MDTNVVELRYKTKEIMAALGRREQVRIFYHGKVKGIIHPAESNGPVESVTKHPFFGMAPEEAVSVDQVMEELRGGRFRAL